MTSFQSTLGDESGIAEELAKGQREISIAEFFEKNKHMLGFDSGARGLVTAVKEAVDNALDATEEAGIQPDIYVEISEVDDYYRLVIEDNGPGITKEQVPKVFGKLLYGSRFHAREQSRGQQGIGISAAVLYSQLTSGKPAKITSRTQGSADAEYFELVIDTDKNEPEIRDEKTTSWDRPHGTRIELEMEANMRARQQLHDYIQHTAVVNPHARLELREPGLDEPMKFERATDQLPQQTEEIRPHPHGVELGTLLKMLGATESYSVSGFLQEEFTRVGAKTTEKIIDSFRDRHFGREMTWKTPSSREADDLVETIEDAVANKGQEATTAFAEELVDIVTGKDRIAHGELLTIVGNVAESVGDDTGKTFGDTVQENIVEAVWPVLTEDRESDVYAIVDDVTTTQKDDAGKVSMARSIATQFAETTGPTDRATYDDVEDFVSWAAERTKEREDETYGETAREKIADAVWSRMRTVEDDVPKVRDIADNRDIARDLLEAMRETDILAPPTDCLSPITSELVEAGLKKEFDADFYAAATRDAEVHGGDPFIVEAGIAYGGDIKSDGSIDLLRFANRVPLVYQRGACTITHVVKDIGWRNYGLDQPGGSGMPKGPAVLMVHVASTNVPFTSESKDALADVPAIQDEVELAIREAARELKSYLSKRRSLQKRRQKQDVIGRILPQMATKLSEVTGREEPKIDGALARIMNNVSVERTIEDGTVTLTVTNYSSTNESPDITDILDVEPLGLNGEANVVDLDGEWFVKWNPTVAAGESETLTYSVEQDASFDINVDGVETEKLTVNA
ncbi:DNA topoisomerase VI subunit B [Haloferax larsenii]|uniref:Type 2 DNA topoisomerase 6 subunit B n=1 Tax=Haloferax larsenii TaxID=302484 RepID=A0ABY5RF46_HALLR|nr:DNA topoisomerase VI subunit B [Haloferax larsenii]UVE49805.1 DNA topoisomerase VI subunit B [Haloferax larsenii]